MCSYHHQEWGLCPRQGELSASWCLLSGRSGADTPLWLCSLVWVWRPLQGHFPSGLAGLTFVLGHVHLL